MTKDEVIDKLTFRKMPFEDCEDVKKDEKWEKGHSAGLQEAIELLKEVE